MIIPAGVPSEFAVAKASSFLKRNGFSRDLGDGDRLLTGSLNPDRNQLVRTNTVPSEISRYSWPLAFLASVFLLSLEEGQLKPGLDLLEEVLALQIGTGIVIGKLAALTGPGRVH